MVTTTLDKNTLTPGTPDNAATISGKTSSAAHAVIDSIAASADQAASKAKPVIDQAASVAHKAVDKTAATVAPAAEWLAEQGDNLKNAEKKMIASTCDYIAENPLKSVGMALLAGFLLSRVAHR